MHAAYFYLIYTNYREWDINQASKALCISQNVVAIIHVHCVNVQIPYIQYSNRSIRS